MNTKVFTDYGLFKYKKNEINFVLIYMFVCNIKINNYVLNAEYFHWISCIKVYLVIIVPPVVILSIYIFLGKKLSISIFEASLTVYPLKLNIKIAFEDAAFTNPSNLKPVDRVSLPNARYHGHRRWPQRGP